VTKYTLVWKVKDGFYLSVEMPRPLEERDVIAMARGLKASGRKGVEIKKEEEITTVTKVTVFDE
jgi:hypothetical protein